MSTINILFRALGFTTKTTNQLPKPSHTPKAPQTSPKTLNQIKPETLDPATTNPSRQEPCLRLMLIPVCNVAMGECAIVYVHTLEL
jgi:hypothetical protein